MLSAGWYLAKYTFCQHNVDKQIIILLAVGEGSPKDDQDEDELQDETGLALIK